MNIEEINKQLKLHDEKIESLERKLIKIDQEKEQLAHIYEYQNNLKEEIQVALNSLDYNQNMNYMNEEIRTLQIHSMKYLENNGESLLERRNHELNNQDDLYHKRLKLLVNEEEKQ